ncbi:hypothetical protein [Sphingobacterium kyonggiense]
MIELPILWLTDEECRKEDLGLPIGDTIDHSNTVMHTFININAIAPVVVDGREYTNIYFNGDCVTATIPYEKVKRMIEEDKLPNLILS